MKRNIYGIKGRNNLRRWNSFSNEPPEPRAEKKSSFLKKQPAHSKDKGKNASAKGSNNKRKTAMWRARDLVEEKR